MNNWKRFTRLDCPVCDGARKDCRQNLQSGLIHCRHTEANPSDYLFRGQDSLGFGLWAYQADAEQWNQAKREEWQQQREREKQAQKQQHRRSLSPKERDREIRKILSQLILSDSHRQQLKTRGFTDSQIDSSNFKSVTQWQKLDFPVSNRLAGTNKNGDKLNNQTDGILVPVPNEDGLFTALRVYNPKSKENGHGKYLWLSSASRGVKAHHQNGENPIAVYWPDELKHTDKIGLCEGLEFKPALAANRLGYPVIGFSGSNFTLSPETTQIAIESIQRKLTAHKESSDSELAIILLADGGSVKNQQVFQPYLKTLDLIQLWGYPASVAWWEQFEKSDGDIDEIPDEKLEAISYLKVDEFLSLAPYSNKATSKNAWSFKKLVSQIKGLASRVKPVGFGKTEPIEPPLIVSLKYRKHERIDTWIKSEAKNLLDISSTGEGKSFDFGRLKPEMFDGIDTIIYVTNDPRNVSTETLKDWPVVEGRHNGLTYNSLGELRRRKNDQQPLAVDPNCYRPKTLEVLASKNIRNATDKSLICKGCPQFEKCSNGIGRYNFLGQRRKALSQLVKVIHSYALPDPSEHDYSRTLIGWEESENSFNTTKTVKVTSEDVKAVIVALVESEDIELLHRFSPFLNKLKKLLEAKQPSRYGWSGQQLKDELLPLLPKQIDYDDLALLLKPDLSFLNPVAEYGENIENLSPTVRKRFSLKDDDLAEVASSDVLKDWLFNLIDALNGHGYLSLAYQELTVSFPDERLIAIARATAKNIFKSATESPKLLESRLGESVEVVSCESFKTDNITFTQLIDLGKMGQQRGQRQQQRANAIIAHYKTTRGDKNIAVIRFKRHSKDDPNALNHFVHSQGTNAAEGKTTLIIDGLPCPNLESLKHDYAVTTGNFPSCESEDFKQYVNYRINSIIKQEIGRNRANRYPDQQFEVIFLTNHDLSWLGLVNQVKAREITPDAESKTERIERLISEAVTQLMSEGKKVTQTAVSQLTGYTQQHISRLKKLLILLINNHKAKCVKNSDPPDNFVYLASEYLPLAEKNELLSVLDLTLSIYPQSNWLILWEFIPDQTRVSLLTQIFALCEVLP